MGWDTLRQRVPMPVLVAPLLVAAIVGIVGSAPSATRAAPGDLVATPEQLDLGPTAVGATSEVAKITISNTGDVPQTMAGSGGPDDALNFVVVFSECTGVSLAPGATCDVSFAFRPSSAGFKETTAPVGNADSPVTVQLTGTGMMSKERSKAVAAGTTGPTSTPATTSASPPAGTTWAAEAVPTTLDGDGLATTGPSSAPTIAVVALVVLAAGILTLSVGRRGAR